MPMKEALPPDVSERLEVMLAGGEREALSAVSDLEPEGNFGFSALIASKKRIVLVYGSQEHKRQYKEIPFEEVASIRLRTYMGNGEIQVISLSRGMSTIRYSRSLDEKFSEAYSVLTELWESSKKRVDEKVVKKAADPWAEENGFPQATAKKARRCPECGAVLSSRGTYCRKCVSKKKLLRRLLAYVLPHKGLAIIGIVLTFGVAVLALLPTYLNKYLIDDILVGKEYGLLKFIALAFVACYVYGAILSGCRQYLMSWLGQEIMYDLRNAAYTHLQRLSLSFFDRRRTGELMSRVSRDTSRVQQFIIQATQQLLVDVLTMFLIGVILFTMNWKLALLVFIPIPVIAGGTMLFSRMVHKIYHRLWRVWASLNAVLTDSISGIRLVKAFGQEKRGNETFARQSAQYFRGEIEGAKVRSKFFPAIRLATSLGTVIILWYGGLLVMRSTPGNEALTLGGLVVFLRFIMRFYSPVQRLSFISHQFQHAITSAQRVFEILDTQPDVKDAPGAITLPEVKGELAFENVYFGYDHGPTILKDITFTIEPGQMVGLVGPSGVGKTTMANLICRFYDVRKGRISLDGVDIRQIKLSSLMRDLGIVLQDPFLFHGTVLENIRYSNPRASLEEVIAAAQAGCAHEFIVRFPDGYDTEVGERGVRLSIGQKQRICIARAIIKNPRILILDEATSSVDTETETLIQKAMENLVKDRTTIVIAHRLSTLRRADKIVVLSEGRVVESGSHEELLAYDGLYASLCGKQALLSSIEAFKEEAKEEAKDEGYGRGRRGR